MEWFAVPSPGEPNTMGALTFLGFMGLVVVSGWVLLPHVLGWFSFVDDMANGMEGFIFILVLLGFYIGLNYL